MKRRLLLHIGYPKTGTTTLQKYIYGALENHLYLGKFEDPDRHGPRAFINQDVESLRNAINYQWDLPFKDNVADLAHRFRLTINAEKKDHRPVILSAEGFSNPLVDTHHLQVKDIAVKAQHLALLFQGQLESDLETHIIMTVRRQVDLLPSYYAQTAHEGEKAGLYGTSFPEFLDFALGDRFLGFGPAFDFYQAACLYKNLFNANCIHVFLMEALFSPKVTAEQRQFAQLFGMDAHEFALRLKGRRANQRSEKKDQSIYEVKPTRFQRRQDQGLIERTLSKLKRSKTRRRFAVHPEDRTRIEAYYHDSNQALGAEFHLPVHLYGY